MPEKIPAKKVAAKKKILPASPIEIVQEGHPVLRKKAILVPVDF